MADFYGDMAQLARDLMAPTADGGLGQGIIELERSIKVPGANEWDAPSFTYERERLNGTARGVSARLVSSPSTGETGPIILATDLQVTCAAPSRPYQTGDTLLLDGRPVTVIQHQQTPAIGTPVTVRFIVRG
jgi:hypothetical protein